MARRSDVCFMNRDDSESPPSSDARYPDDGAASGHPDAVLPPVEPPSAGFIVQLFVVPAIIVAGVVGVYLLFGRLASGELDWREQLVNVRSENPNVRWRGALGLAQMLDADARRGAEGQRLAHNPEIADALSKLYAQTRGERPRDEERGRQLDFLSKALGRVDVHEAVLPPLSAAIEQELEDREARKDALTAIAMIAGRAREQGAGLMDAALGSLILSVSREADSLWRHQAAFILGLLPAAAATERLEELLADADAMTRANAAIGLARRGSLLGLPVFEEVFAEAALSPLDPHVVGNDQQAEAYFERSLLLSNSLKAVALLQPQLTGADRQRVAELLRPLTEVTRDAAIRIEVKQLLNVLSSE